MKHCNLCPNEIKCSSLTYCIKGRKKSHYQKAKEGKIQQTIPEEKKKALARDKRCVYCRSQINLDFHHCYYRALERKYGQDRNKAENGVILCRSCHRNLTDGNRVIDLFVRGYLNKVNS